MKIVHASMIFNTKYMRFYILISGVFALTSSFSLTYAFTSRVPRSNIGNAAIVKRPDAFMSSSRQRDDEALNGMCLDESTLTTAEKERIIGLRSIQSSLDEVERFEKQLMQTAKNQKLKYEDDEDEVVIEVRDTLWSGQAGLDSTIKYDRNWSDISKRKVLAVGDIFALTVFCYIGRSMHGNSHFDFEVITTALPFYTGWLFISPLLGAYSNIATATQKEMLQTLIPAWAVSIPVALVLRGALKGEIPPTPFIITSMIATGIILTGWRAIYTSINPTSTAEKKRGGILDGFKMIQTLLSRW